MENKIITALDNLDIAQTERLIGENMEIKIKGKDRRRIESAVFEKMGAKQKKRVYAPRKLIAAALAATLFTLTITAGAVTNWDYGAVARYFFGGSENVVEGSHKEINYEVISNTFEGLSFEVVGLYADSESLLVAVEITAEELVFEIDNDDFLRILVDVDKTNFLPDSHVYGTFPTIVNANTVFITFHFPVLEDKIEVGNEYIIPIDEIRKYQLPAGIYNVFLPGQADIKVVIDKLATQNLIHVYPNVTLESGNVLTEVKINPFNIRLHFDGEDGDFGIQLNEDSKFETIVSVVTHGGEQIDMSPNNSSGIVFDPRDKYKMFFFIPYEEALDVDDIAGIIFKGVEIPLN